jgi:hypothetical protein
MKEQVKRVNNSIDVLTQHMRTNVITGARITFSMEDARAMYNTTTLPLDTAEGKHDVNISTEHYQQLMESREILRTIAKAVLFQAGDATVVSSLISNLQSMTNPVDDQMELVREEMI